MRPARPALFAFAVGLLSACASDGLSQSPSQRLVATDWRADILNGASVAISNPVTLSFNEGNASGRGGCNQYSGTVEFDDNHITFGSLISTRMACIGNDIMTTEARYLGALQASHSYAVAPDGTLTLTDGTSNIHFVPQPRQIRP